MAAPLEGDEAQSEIVGAVMLVTITVVMMVGLAFYMETTTRIEERVYADLRVSTNSTRIVLEHLGGEPVPLAGTEVTMLLNGTVERKPLEDYASAFADGSPALWEIGETLCLTCRHPGALVQDLRVSLRNAALLVWDGRVEGSGDPDLVADIETMSPAAPVAGQSVTFTARVTNQGGTSVPDAASILVRFYVNGTLLGSTTQPGPLSPGSSFATTSPSWTSVAGTHTLEARVDPDNTIVEDDEDNNIGTRLQEVLPDAPDLRGSILSWTPASPIDGETVRVRAEIRNAGGAATPGGTDIVARFWIGGTQISSNHTAGPLAAGAAFELWSGDWTAVAGTPTVEVRVDPDGNISEADETNNLATATLSVATAVADPGFAYEDTNCDAKYSSSGDTAISNATILAGTYNAQGNCLVIPQTVGNVSASTVSYQSQKDVRILTNVTATTLLEIRSTGGAVYLRDIRLRSTEDEVRVVGNGAVNATLLVVNASKEITIHSDTAVVDVIDARFTSEGEEIRVEAGGRVLANDARLESRTDAAYLTASGNVHLNGATLIAQEDIIVDAGATTNTIHVASTRLDDSNDKAKALPSGVGISGTPASGAIDYVG